MRRPQPSENTSTGDPVRLGGQEVSQFMDEHHDAETENAEQ